MTGQELKKKLKRIAKKRQVTLEWLPRRGKGSHGTLVMGDRFAVIPSLKTELKKGTLLAILKQLEISWQELEG